MTAKVCLKITFNFISSTDSCGVSCSSSSYTGSHTDKPPLPARFKCSWHAAHEASTETAHATSWQSIDVQIESISKSSKSSWPGKHEGVKLAFEYTTQEQSTVTAHGFGSLAAFDLLLDSLEAAHREGSCTVRVIVPRSEGYIVRSDIITIRLLDCELVRKTASFANTHRFFDGKEVSINNIEQLPKIFAAAAGGLLLKQRESTCINTLDLLPTPLDLELQNRLSFPWISKQAPRRKVLAVFEGGRGGPETGGSGESIYTAAAALGIDMVVFDEAGHWLEGPKYARWRKAFIPFQLEEEYQNGTFTDRVVEVVRDYIASNGPVDGIITGCEHYKVQIAEAALQLSLPTSPPAAYAIVTDKFKTSVSEGHHAYVASSVEQAASIVEKNKLEFPLIIKPCNGWLSEGVLRTENLPQLLNGVRAIDTKRHGDEFVIEKYCEGPEVDANFVICDGKLLFFEVSDDFPKGGDVNGQSKVESFVELANVLPSKLPEQEIAELRDSLHQSLLRVGFRNGFYHVEARMENSSMKYSTKYNVLDLNESPVPARGAPSTWLIEINPRPPGIQESAAVTHTYGIDYWGIALLFPLEEYERIKQLSYPFVQGPQYWCEMVFIPTYKGGIFKSDDVCKELFERHPSLEANVSSCYCFLKKGQQVTDPKVGLHPWVGYFVVFSRASRRHLLELSDFIRAELRVSIV
jgi:hypothetical protein